MRIGMILDAVFPPDPRVENEAVSLVKAGHEVFLFCLKYANEKTSEIINGIQVKRYTSNQLEYKLSALAYTIPLYTFLMQKKIHQFIKETNIEALHIHDIRIAEAVFNANKKYKVPVVLDLHDNMPEVMKLYPHLQKFPGKYVISPKKWKQKEEEFILKADKVISVSPEFIETLQIRLPIEKEKFVLVPNTIRKSFYEAYKVDATITEKYKNKFVILYLGDTHIRRGLQTAISAVDTLKLKIPNLKLVIVGKNTTDTILKQQVKYLNITDFVDFEGWQNVTLFQSYILSSAICISPLHRNLQHDVAYANKIFQYMSLGKPLLVSDAIAQKRLIERTNSGLVHQEKNVDDFINQVLKLYNDASLRNELGENGKKFVRNEFSWEQTSKKLLYLYDNLQN
ncbi:MULTISPECIES: glycosyltransferase family 4 protein [unclassified Polaribacter]|uniref:glycosyltransferase family 4 protein n=1 Tax=unclassified Polaribacter TaxID=196858 RepID=UPI0011BDEF34|nr:MULTISPECIES: glycosyltransferase family 4 protein [unclassified Polaribacter]TXD52048.1 glycosyltransferase family 4 protein [Polaribacter sp. IC063]TXD59770.1 glycosyltransferase family 4 protein [Polaribacter sp. IC066]